MTHIRTIAENTIKQKGNIYLGLNLPSISTSGIGKFDLKSIFPCAFIPIVMLSFDANLYALPVRLGKRTAKSKNSKFLDVSISLKSASCKKDNCFNNDF